MVSNVGTVFTVIVRWLTVCSKFCRVGYRVGVRGVICMRKFVWGVLLRICSNLLLTGMMSGLPI